MDRRFSAVYCGELQYRGAAVNIDHTPYEAEKLPNRPCALLWDESFIWGLMAWRALKEARLPFDVLRSEDVRRGALCRYRMIFVPGGWASNKIDALGDKGMEEIRRFVAGGGNYLGICGGAGMATENGLGLLPIKRKPPRERVPSFSGSFRLSLADHRIWQGIETPVFFAWWPSQFQTGDQRTHVLASYEEELPDAFSSDVPVADGRIIGWPDLEMQYAILLDPARLHGEPAVLEGHSGLGKVVLSLIHFDTPGDRNGTAVLRNLWDYLASGCSSKSQVRKVHSQSLALSDPWPEIRDVIEEIQNAVAELIASGSRNFLWYWRNPLLLNWRRGVRGLEYGTLAVMIGEIGKYLGGTDGRPALSGSIDQFQLKEKLTEIRDQLIPFAERAKHLVIRERCYMNTAHLSPMECADGEINRMRQELFGSAMSHGGDFKQLIDIVDCLLFNIIRET